MSAPLFEMPGVSAAVIEPPEPAPMQRWTERRMLDLLVQRYTRLTLGAHRYAFGEHVGDQPAFPHRIADFVAVDCWKGSYQFPIHGHEVKVSRSDWLAELKQPVKAEAFRPYCDFWWLVVANAAIVRDDLPAGWGLLVVAGNQLRQAVAAKRNARQPMPRPMSVSLMRAVAKTARRGSGAAPEGATR